MEFARKHKDQIIRMYIEEKQSCIDIAKSLNTYPTKIARALTFLGVQKRSYSEAQKTALEQGRIAHPTKGKKLSDEQKVKLSESISASWKKLTPEELDAIKALRKEKWDAMSIEDRKELQSKAHQAIRESSKNGSKTERFISEQLENLGYGVIIHARNLIQSAALEVDLFVPSLKTAIEIDGPSHFFPIWGADKLKKQQSADAAKQGLLLNAGYVIIRIRQLDNFVSAKKMRQVLEIITAKLKDIELNFPPREKRLIEIEVKDGVANPIC